MSRLRHAFLILLGKLEMEEHMLEQTTALAQQLDTNVKAFVTALSDAKATIAQRDQTISELQTQLQTDAAAADTAGVALLQPIVNETQQS